MKHTGKISLIKGDFMSSVAYVVLAVILLFSVQDLSAQSVSYQGRSIEWHKRNDHLIPDAEESKGIMALHQDYSKPWRTREDSDGDGVPDAWDPSAYDWRETGYEPFGVLEFLSWNHPWNNYKYDKKGLDKIVGLLKEAGVTCVRFDFLWQDMEPSQGAYDFDKYDYLVELLTVNQIRILGVLSYSASWAGKAWNYPPYDNVTFVNYVAKVVGRYKDKVKYWEIWNEPDSSTYWVPRDEMKRYTQLLKESYVAAKKEDPSCKIVLGGMTSTGYYALKNIYRNGGKDYFDVFNIHPFANPLGKGPIRLVKGIYTQVRKEMVKNGDGHKKIWFTEIGAPGVKRRNKLNGWWEGLSPTEKQQARWVKKIYSELISLEDVEKIFWAFFRDNKEHFKSGVDYFGIVRWDYSKKPAFNAYRECSRKWHRLKGDGPR
jgi:hypothetical protein